jgi:hypothetical protein
MYYLYKNKENYPGDFKRMSPIIDIDNIYSCCLVAFSVFQLHLINTKLKYVMKNYRKKYIPVKLVYAFFGLAFLLYFNFNFMRYCIWRYQIYEFGKKVYFESITDTRNLEFKYLLKETNKL